MVFELFLPSKVDALAHALGNEVAKRYPPAVANDPERTISRERRATILQGVFAGVHRFKQQSHFGIFRKARLSNTFRWTLRGMGYDENFIDTATEMLLASLAQSPHPGAAGKPEPSAIE